MRWGAARTHVSYPARLLKVADEQNAVVKIALPIEWTIVSSLTYFIGRLSWAFFALHLVDPNSLLRKPGLAAEASSPPYV